MKRNEKQGWKNGNLQTLISLSLTVILLFGLSNAGFFGGEKKTRLDVSTTSETENVNTLFHAIKDNIPFTATDKEGLLKLTGQFMEGDLEGAARVLYGYEVPFDVYPFFFDGNTIKTKLGTGKGLVFLKSSICYYGEMVDGKPHGKGTLLSVLKLKEGKRYDYSYGMFQNGQMNGEGECGYRYYDEMEQEMAVKTAKKGMFQKDLMQGEIVYTSTNASGDTAQWQFQVKDGVIVPDDRWIQDLEEDGSLVYKLPAKEDKEHVYLLTERGIKESRWKNLIVFDNFNKGGIDP
ncbi:hypothetical protein [Clostridium sp. E02]|uniref:hypothetical protein n=1 Tax=Clostridium sp. E02 TaxID=2487134 RepID=UPI000F51D30A|nr:hypothetical protein [Clostridium sp. E02]